MKKYFEKSLAKAWDLKLHVWDLVIAEEVDCVVCKIGTENYEDCCFLVKEAFLKSEDLSVNVICKALCNLLKRKSIEDIDRYELLEEACWC